MINITMSNSQFNFLKKVIEKYEIGLIEKYDIHRDNEFHPYYYDYYLDKTISSDDLVQEVVDLDEILSTLNSVSIKQCKCFQHHEALIEYHLPQ